MKGCKDDEGTRALLIVGKAETSGAVQPEEDKTEGDLLNAYRCLKGRFKDRARLFPVVPVTGPENSGHKLKHRRFLLNIRKNFFTLRVTVHGHRLPREMVEFTPLDIVKSHPHMVLGSQLCVALCEQEGWTR